MKYHVTQYAICVPLNDPQWKKLAAREERNWKEIHTRLEAAGAEGVDYNGHFGRCIFFKVENLDAVEKVTAALLNYLATPLKEIPKY